MPRTRRLSKLKVVVILLLLGGVSAYLIVKYQPFKTSVVGPELGTVRRLDLVQDVSVAGTIVPLRRTIFTPPYNAYIKKLFVRMGGRVKEGDPVVSLEQSLNSRNEEAFPLRAPFDGVVVQVLHNEGEYVETAKDTGAMVRIDDLSRLFVTAEVPETDVDKIRVGLPAVIKATPVLSKSYRGIIREIFQAAIEKQQNFTHSGDRVEFQVKLEILDADRKLKPGMSTLVSVITEERKQVLGLPHEFIQKAKDQYFVTLANGQKRNISVGLQNDEMFEVREGLAEGDRVKMVDFASLPQQGS